MAQRASAATVLLDRLLHHAIVIAIEGISYRLREHAALVPEALRAATRPVREPPPETKRRGLKTRKNPHLGGFSGCGWTS